MSAKERRSQSDMDVGPIMNKTTVRFVGVGAGLLLGALVLALAQHDARESSESELVLAKPSAEPPKLIPVDDSPLWGHAFASHKTIVRANDDPPAAPPSLDYTLDETAPPSPLPQAPALDNPLRGASGSLHDDTSPTLAAYSDADNIQLAGGEGPPKLNAPNIPSTTPATQVQPAPALAAPGVPPGDVIRAPKPGWTQAPPAVPGNTGARPSTSANLSDVQMPAMPTTNLAAPPAMPNTTLQSPPTLAMPPANGLGNGLGSASLNNPPIPNPAYPAASPSRTELPGTSSSGLNTNTSRTTGQLITAPQPGVPSASGSAATGGMPSSTNFPSAPAATLGSPVPSPAGSSALGSGAPNYGSTNPNSLGGGAMDGGRSPFAGTMIGRLISNKPGSSALDGSQNPVMLIQKRVAGECQVGKKATVIITVRNAGNSTAQEVEVIDSIPNGASFAESMQP